MKTARQLVHDAFRLAASRDGHCPKCVRDYLYSPTTNGADIAGIVHDIACDELTQATEFDRLRAKNERALADFAAGQEQRDFILSTSTSS